MTTYIILATLGKTFLGLAIGFLLLTVLLFFLFKIPELFADITGKTRKNTISNMASSFSQTGTLATVTPSGQPPVDNKKSSKSKSTKRTTAVKDKNTISGVAPVSGKIRAISKHDTTSNLAKTGFSIIKDVCVIHTSETIS